MADALLVGAEELENLGTRYLAAVLRQAGYDVQLAAFSTEEEMQAVVRRAALLQPRLVGLSIIFQYRALEFMKLAAALRQALPKAHITAGGHFPTFTAPELLRDTPALDSIVRGEGEHTLLELVDNLNRPDRWREIRGLSFREDGKVIENQARPLVADLDTIPFAAR
ncbi:MAG: B12-binding domain-containing radical SAM protein, partial [Rudaea sp.]